MAYHKKLHSYVELVGRSINGVNQVERERALNNIPRLFNSYLEVSAYLESTIDKTKLYQIAIPLDSICAPLMSSFLSAVENDFLLREK